MIFNVPLTYPPEPLNGIMITGMMTPSIESNFTYPKELKDEILAEYPDYQLDIKSGAGFSRNFEILEALENSLDVQMEIIEKYVREQDPDLLFAVFIMPDRIQHTYSQFINPKSTIYDTKEARKRRSRIVSAYEKLDRALGRLLETAPEGTNMIIISDHGFTMESGAFYTNDFLAHLGLLSLKPGRSRGMVRRVIRRFNVPAVKKFLPPKAFHATLNLTKEAIDWSKTLAYASSVSQQGIHINLTGRSSHGIVPQGDYESLRGKIIEAVDAVVDKEGCRVVKAFRREELFSGPLIDCVPDIVLIPSDSGVETKEVILGGDYLVYTDGGSRGRHAGEGVFIAVGPHVKPGRREELHLEDIAPNVLAISGVDGPFEEMDGRLRPDVFDFVEAKAGV